jgi:hypothetical protein
MPTKLRAALPLLLVLSIAACGLTVEAWRLGMTADEPSHLAAACAWWEGTDTLNPSDTPPLMRIISGWAPRAMGIRLDRNSEEWKSRDAYRIGAVMVSAQTPRRARMLLFLMRLPFIAFPLLIAVLCWRWGGELFGKRIGLLLAICALLEPTILGHGALIKSDAPAAFGALWFAYAGWRFWIAPGARTLFWMAASVVIATLIKFTLLPVLGVAVILALLKGWPLTGGLGIPIAYYVATLAAYQFQAAPPSAGVIGVFRLAGVPRLLMPLAIGLAKLPWPGQYVRGLLFIMGALHGQGFAGYMLGHKISGQVIGYYPLAWAIKFPIALQILTVGGLAALLSRIWKREAGPADAFIWGSAAFYFGAALFTSYHIGFRHVLPALPFFILGGGFALAKWARGKVGGLAASGLILWLAISSLRVYPQGISYFNEWIGGPENGWKYLADSNVDWGQNFPELVEFVRDHKIPMIKTFLFGLDLPERYGITGVWESQEWPASPDSMKPRVLTPFRGYYAISINALTGFLAPPGYEDYLADFRKRTPIGRAGYSILIYRVR